MQQLAARVFDFMGDVAQNAEPLSELLASFVAGLMKALERWAEPVSEILAGLMKALEWLCSFVGERAFPMTEASLALPE
ncbi:hypothetical protein Q664_27935 [Archangium violaceum Cb vi76]|uniref:Uncharacterized protein n=1 Tax=Archangium violaceum Cb vi76 TaxID=1406225 RepID=A0A084SPZ0_9BACT|nr:hypothetical protein Q664_27935 [Archangium violaceum Cb vi76]